LSQDGPLTASSPKSPAEHTFINPPPRNPYTTRPEIRAPLPFVPPPTRPPITRATPAPPPIITGAPPTQPLGSGRDSAIDADDFSPLMRQLNEVVVPQNTPSIASPTSSTMERLDELQVPTAPIDESKRTIFQRQIIMHVKAIQKMSPEEREKAFASWHAYDQPILRSLVRVADQGVTIDAATVDEFDPDYLQLKRIADHQELFGEYQTPSPITPKSASSVESLISANGDGPRYRPVPPIRRRSVRRNIQAPRGEFTFRVGRQLFEDMRVDGAELEPGDIGNRKRKVKSVEKAIKRQRSTAPQVRRRKGAINSFRNYDTLRS